AGADPGAGSEHAAKQQQCDGGGDGDEQRRTQVELAGVAVAGGKDDDVQITRSAHSPPPPDGPTPRAPGRPPPAHPPPDADAGLPAHPGRRERLPRTPPARRMPVRFRKRSGSLAVQDAGALRTKKVLTSGNPAVVAFALDRWLCVPAFRRVCPCAVR